MYVRDYLQGSENGRVDTIVINYRQIYGVCRMIQSYLLGHIRLPNDCVVPTINEQRWKR
jgi:hypothetical protein